MKDKKLIILIILAIGAAISLIYGITAPPRGRARGVKTVAAVPGEKPSTRVPVPADRLGKKTTYEGWKRNPFAPSGSGRSGELALGGIMWQEENPRAMISDSLVSKGDVVEGCEVIEIKRDRVILKSGTETITLKLGE